MTIDENQEEVATDVDRSFQPQTGHLGEVDGDVLELLLHLQND